jgi:hypothetical protein
MPQQIKKPKVGVKYNVVPHKDDSFFRSASIDKGNSIGFEYIKTKGCIYFKNSIFGKTFIFRPSVKIYKFSKNFKMPE